MVVSASRTKRPNRDLNGERSFDRWSLRLQKTVEFDGGTSVSDIDIARGRIRSGSRRPLQSIFRKKPRKRFRGIPPPLTFDLDGLPDSTLLNESETAAACRRAKSTLEVWRKQADHPLQWRRVAGRVLYELSSIRAFLKGGAGK